MFVPLNLGLGHLILIMDFITTWAYFKKYFIVSWKDVTLNYNVKLQNNDIGSKKLKNDAGSVMFFFSNSKTEFECLEFVKCHWPEYNLGSAPTKKANLYISITWAPDNFIN